MNQIHKRVLVQIGAQKFSSLHKSGVGARDLPCLTRSYRRWQTTGRETSGNNGRYRPQIFLLLFFGEYQACLRVLIDKCRIMK